MGLSVDEHEKLEIEGNDARSFGLFDVASFWPCTGRTQLGSRVNVQILFRAVYQPRQLGN